jgi:Flp pilus assembly protein TadG
MLRSTLHRPTRRRGVTVVESAAVMSVFLLLLFGMFEYCRFLMVLHVTNNAAREGARYAVVNVDKPTDFDYVDFTDASGRRFDNIQKYTTARMGGIHTRNIEGFRVACYAIDPAGLSQNPPVVRPKAKPTASAGTYPNPFDNVDANRVPWNAAVFTEKIAVTVDGTYRPILPTFLFMPNTISVKTTALAGSEG